MKQRKRLEPANFVSARASIALHIVVLAFVTIFVYWGSLNGEFVFDDTQIVLQNPVLLNIHSLSDVVKLGFSWRQLLFFTYGFNYYWNGLSPYGYHVFNLVLHVINVALVYLIVFEIAGRRRGSECALVGATVFAVHPLMSSAVSYIAGRSSVLCAVFYFLATLLFLKGLNPELRPRARAVYFVLTAVAGVLAWQSKQEAITLPALLAALFWLKHEKRTSRWMVALAALPIVIAALMWKELSSLFSTVSENKILVSAGFDSVLPAGAYFRTYITSIVGYCFPRFLFPANLSADPYVAPVAHWYSPEFLVSALILATVAWLMVRRATTEPLITVGISAILLSPLSAYALIPLADVVLEHRAYIPALGIALLAAALFRWLWKDSATAGIAVALVVAFVLGAMTIQRNRVFANEIALWEDTVRKSPEKARAHYTLATAYQLKGRFSEAIPEYEKAIAIKRDLYAAYSNLAAMQIDAGRLNEGERTLVKLTEAAPDYSDGFVNLAALYLRKQDPAKALEASERALKINPASYAATFNKAEALTMRGSLNDALTSYISAASLRPDIASLHVSVAQAIMRVGGEESQVMGHLQRALQVNANEPSAHYEIGVIYLRKDMMDRAIPELETSLRGRPDFAPAVLNLSLAYQRKGEISAARKVLETYLAQFGRPGAPFVADIQSRLTMLPKS
jgi:protein O-mannosyl-transferase